jgi:hypothetical protein
MHQHWNSGCLPLILKGITTKLLTPTAYNDKGHVGESYCVEGEGKRKVHTKTEHEGPLGE